MSRSGFIKYIYWSDRSITDVCDDNGLTDTANTVGLGVKTPNPAGAFGEVAVSVSREHPQRSGRATVARLIEKRLERSIAVDGIGRSPLATSAGRIVFQSFDEPGDHRRADPNYQTRAIMFTELHQADDVRTAVCLFGSMHNFEGWLADERGSVGGWTSSAFYDVMTFLKNRSTGHTYLSEKGIALEALKIAYRHGYKYGDDETCERYPWMRGYVWGDCVADAEWFAHIYLDVRVDTCDPVGFQRILVGAPLWIRTTRWSDVRSFREFPQRQKRFKHERRRYRLWRA